MKLTSLTEMDDSLRGAERGVRDDPSRLVPFLQGLIRAGRVTPSDLQFLVLCGVPGIAAFMESIGEMPVEASSADDFIDIISTDPQLVRWVVAWELLEQKLVPEEIIKDLATASANFVNPMTDVAWDRLRREIPRLSGQDTGGSGPVLDGLFLLTRHVTPYRLQSFFPWAKLEQLQQLFLTSAFKLGTVPKELASLVN